MIKEIPEKPKRKKSERVTKANNPTPKSKRQRQVGFTKEAWATILDFIASKNGTIGMDEIDEFSKPFFIYDPIIGRDTDRRRRLNQKLAGEKSGSKGNRGRKFLTCKDNGEAVCVDIDTSQDQRRLSLIIAQLEDKRKGLDKTKQKVRRRKIFLHENQISFDWNMNAEPNN